MEHIYEGNVVTGRPMRVFWLFTGGASSLKAAIEDPNHGVLYDSVGAYTDKEGADGRKLCDGNNERGIKIPNFFISRKEFYRAHGLDPKAPGSREKFYEMLSREIEPFDPDLICLSGYMHIVSDPLLTEYKHRILNVHPAELTIMAVNMVGSDITRLNEMRLDAAHAPPDLVRAFIDSCRKSKPSYTLARKFTGDNAVYDAIVAGEPATRSTVHILTKEVDGGPIIVQSRAFPVSEELRERVRKEGPDSKARKDFQEMMKKEGDGPAYLEALRIISQGRLSIDAETLFLDGTPLPYRGINLGE